MVANLSYGTGRRKTAVARVFLREGKGAITVNGKTIDEYFKIDAERAIVRQPLDVTNTLERFDVVINVRGGGHTGQCEACRHGLARALAVYDVTNRSVLRANGFLTRDPRMVERKKYGQKGARRRFQFSKR
ncbi:MAG TPA: 30S ribosomal protein S9 [Spirochaetia bacterium]|nr:30S ribosomal protein S9 [Spirochaetia bacterium]